MPSSSKPGKPFLAVLPHFVSSAEVLIRNSTVSYCLGFFILLSNIILFSLLSIPVSKEKEVVPDFQFVERLFDGHSLLDFIQTYLQEDNLTFEGNLRTNTYIYIYI